MDSQGTHVRCDTQELKKVYSNIRNLSVVIGQDYCDSEQAQRAAE